jgi:hypothetical protein
MPPNQNSRNNAQVIGSSPLGELEGAVQVSFPPSGGRGILTVVGAGPGDI